jgi:hypothetical protein
LSLRQLFSRHISILFNTPLRLEAFQSQDIRLHVVSSGFGALELGHRLHYARFANDRRQNAVTLDSCQSSTITVTSGPALGLGTTHITDTVVTNIVYVTVWASVSTITSTLSQCPADSNLAKSPTTGSSTLPLSLSDISSTSWPILQATGTSLSSTISSLGVSSPSTIKGILLSTTQVSTISRTVTTSSYSCNVSNLPPPGAGTVQMSGVSKSI